MDHMRISDAEPSSIILSQKLYFGHIYKALYD